MLIYATKLDLAKYITGDPDALEGEAPADSLKQLQSASILIRRATSHAVYNVNTDGYPVLASVVDAMRDATCAMAAAYSALGVNVQTGGLDTDRVIVSKSLGSASVTYESSTVREAAKAALATGAVLNQEAYSLLRSAGLMNAAVYSDGVPTEAWASGPWPVS